jgi:hypothetical protein
VGAAPTPFGRLELITYCPAIFSETPRQMSVSCNQWPVGRTPVAGSRLLRFIREIH